jgi:hypothetical protein
MKLLTKAIETQLAKHPMYSGEKETVSDVVVKFFTPSSNWTWYVLEGSRREDGDWEFFGLVDGHEKELGYFCLSELASVRGSFGLPVERDRWFDGHKVNKETLEVMS